MKTSQPRRRPARKRSASPRLSARAVSAICLAVLFLARPHLAVLVLDGFGIVLGLAVLAGLTYLAGIVAGRFKPPARIQLGWLNLEFL